MGTYEQPGQQIDKSKGIPAAGLAAERQRKLQLKQIEARQLRSEHSQWRQNYLRNQKLKLKIASNQIDLYSILDKEISQTKKAHQNQSDLGLIDQIRGQGRFQIQHLQNLYTQGLNDPNKMNDYNDALLKFKGQVDDIGAGLGVAMENYKTFSEGSKSETEAYRDEKNP